MFRVAPAMFFAVSGSVFMHTDTTASSRENRGASNAFTAGAASLLLAVAAMAMAGLGSRWGWWHFSTGFTILRWAGYAALAAAVVTLGAALLVRGGGRRRTIIIAAGLALVAVAVVAVPWQWRRTARTVPRIHDITTDTENPPEFVALRERPGAVNPVEYGGPEVASQQRAGYPDIGPVTLSVPPAQAVERAAATARDLGWKVVAVDTGAGRVEATDRTLWFGFYDDVVIRVTPAAGGSRVDVRSLSRVGGSDVGTNARRIRTFVERLTSRD